MTVKFQYSNHSIVCCTYFQKWTGPCKTSNKMAATMERDFWWISMKITYLWRITACQCTIVHLIDTSQPSRTDKGNIKTVRMKMWPQIAWWQFVRLIFGMSAWCGGAVSGGWTWTTHLGWAKNTIRQISPASSTRGFWSQCSLRSFLTKWHIKYSKFCLYFI
jgi:hypothetical protein